VKLCLLIKNYYKFAVLNSSTGMLLFIKTIYILRKLNPPRFRGGFFSPAVKLLVFLTFFSFWFGCTEPDEIGLGLIDDLAGFGTTDTLSLLAYTIRMTAFQQILVHKTCLE
jgi:hypothetical protein